MSDGVYRNMLLRGPESEPGLGPQPQEPNTAPSSEEAMLVTMRAHLRPVIRGQKEPTVIGTILDPSQSFLLPVSEMPETLERAVIKGPDNSQREIPKAHPGIVAHLTVIETVTTEPKAIDTEFTAPNLEKDKHDQKVKPLSKLYIGNAQVSGLTTSVGIAHNASLENTRFTPELCQRLVHIGDLDHFTQRGEGTGVAIAGPEIPTDDPEGLPGITMAGIVYDETGKVSPSLLTEEDWQAIHDGKLSLVGWLGVDSHGNVCISGSDTHLSQQGDSPTPCILVETTAPPHLLEESPMQLPSIQSVLRAIGISQESVPEESSEGHIPQGSANGQSVTGSFVDTGEVLAQAMTNTHRPRSVEEGDTPMPKSLLSLGASRRHQRRGSDNAAFIID